MGRCCTATCAGMLGLRLGRDGHKGMMAYLPTYLLTLPHMHAQAVREETHACAGRTGRNTLQVAPVHACAGRQAGRQYAHGQRYVDLVPQLLHPKEHAPQQRLGHRVVAQAPQVVPLQDPPSPAAQRRRAAAAVHRTQQPQCRMPGKHPELRAQSAALSVLAGPASDKATWPGALCVVTSERRLMRHASVLPLPTHLRVAPYHHDS